MCLCGLLGSCTSTAYCIEGGVFNFSSWEDETGKDHETKGLFEMMESRRNGMVRFNGIFNSIPSYQKLRRIVSNVYVLYITLLDSKGESLGFIYISSGWNPSVH